MAEAQKTYDLTTWNSLLQIDADIAAAAAYLGGFGQRYVDDLADSYLAIGEKRYLAVIVAKIQRQAEDEARAGAQADPETTPEARTANDNERSTPRPDPEFDAARWNELANEDPDIEAAIVAVGRFGSYYAADLAASYQAIDDKRYLKRIVETIIAEAQADIAHSRNAQSAPSATAGTTSNPKSDSTRRKSVPGDHAQSARPPGSSAQTGKTTAKTATLRTRKGGPDQGLAFTALGMFLFLFVVAAGLTLYDYTTFRAAHGDADRLEDYQHNCWICVFAGQARHEEAVAAEEATARLRGIAIATDRRNYEAARGDIYRLTAYIGACRDCLFKGAAELELSELHKQADIAETNARIAALQRQQQLSTPPPQPYELPRQVSWRITNGTEVEVTMQFFSQTRKGFRWPAPDMRWPVNPGQTQDYSLACQSGEKICFGATYSTQTWGVGYGSLTCTNCCVICDGKLHTIDLTEANSVTLD